MRRSPGTVRPKSPAQEPPAQALSPILLFGRVILRAAAAAGLMLAGCSLCAAQDAPQAPHGAQNSQDTEYVFGVYPLHNPEQVMGVYGPLIAYIDKSLGGGHLRLEPSSSYVEFEARLLAHRYAFAITNPYQTVLAADHGYKVFGKLGDDEEFRGVILVRPDSGVEKVTDLKGKAVSFIALTTVGATMLPQYYLHTHGLDVNRDIRSLYTGSHESSILNVYYGFTSAGATRPPQWRLFQRAHPEKAKDLIVKWETEPLIDNGVVARNDTPEELVNRVGSIMFSLQDSEAGRRLLEAIPTSRFEPANGATYDRARVFLRQFEANVRPLGDK